MSGAIYETRLVMIIVEAYLGYYVYCYMFKIYHNQVFRNL